MSVSPPVLEGALLGTRIAEVPVPVARVIHHLFESLANGPWVGKRVWSWN